MDQAEEVTTTIVESAARGLDEISLWNEHGCSYQNEGSGCETDEEDAGGEGNGQCRFKLNDDYALNCVEDFGKINMSDLSSQNIMRFHFADIGVAFKFYNWYGSLHGFGPRKSKVLWNSKGEGIQQTFLCNREGYKEPKHMIRVEKKCEPKQNTRCGCTAKCHVHVEESRGRWFIKYFNDGHNHRIEERYTGMLPVHRNISEHDKCQMNTMREVDIKTPHIYGVFASQARSYENVGFSQRDIYNDQKRDRRSKFSDAKVALDFLESLRVKDEMMFWRHTVDDVGRLEHLFWCKVGLVGSNPYSLLSNN